MSLQKSWCVPKKPKKSVHCVVSYTHIYLHSISKHFEIRMHITDLFIIYLFFGASRKWLFEEQQFVASHVGFNFQPWRLLRVHAQLVQLCVCVCMRPNKTGIYVKIHWPHSATSNQKLNLAPFKYSLQNIHKSGLELKRTHTQTIDNQIILKLRQSQLIGQLDSKCLFRTHPFNWTTQF